MKALTKATDFGYQECTLEESRLAAERTRIPRSTATLSGE
jgi:hypothetical protein